MFRLKIGDYYKNYPFLKNSIIKQNIYFFFTPLGQYIIKIALMGTRREKEILYNILSKLHFISSLTIQIKQTRFFSLKNAPNNKDDGSKTFSN